MDVRGACALLLAFASAACGSSSSSSPAGDGGSDAATASDGPSTGDAPLDVQADVHGDAPKDAPADTSSTPPGDAGLPDVFSPVPDGGVFMQFVKADESANFDPAQEEKSTGTITFGAANGAASDNQVANLTRTGGQAAIGTAGAVEIVSNRSFSFGTYRFRFSLAACASTEEAVNGVFSYFNDGSKAPDGLVINREVDIEVLCGEPWLVNLTIWTEYTDDTHMKNQSRVVDTKNGKVLVFAPDQSGNVTSTEDHPELLIPSWPAAGAFYEMGWTWAPDHLRYFMKINGSDVTLWDATDATRIPQAPMAQHFNLWAPGIHWSTGAKAGPPASDATLALDWFRYDPQ